MLKKLFSKLGFGSAKIDLQLDQDTVVMGETITGKLIVQGGEFDQEINEVMVHLKVKSNYRQNDSNRYVNMAIASSRPVESFYLQKNERKEFPFKMNIPNYIAMSSLNTRYYFSSNLDIEDGLDSDDCDYVTILPSGLMKNFMEGFGLLGCKVRGEGFTGTYQLLDFQTTTWLRGKLDELVFHFEPAQSHSVIAGHFEIDKKTFGAQGALMDKLDLDEKKGYYSFSKDQLATPKIAAETIQRFVEGHYKHLLG